MRSPITRQTRKAASLCRRAGLAALYLALFVAPLLAQAEPSARWLLVVDTSMSMQTRAKNTEIVVHDLLANGMNGQMARGDTLGIWTFNNHLHTGEAPLQTWSPEEARTIADQTTQFVAGQKYEKSTDFNAMMKEMLNVVQASDLITVLIISDADDSIKGTPFDAQINEIYKQRYRQQKKFKMPFITVLRGERGKLNSYAVNLAQFAIDIPPIKREAPKPPVVAQPKPAPKPVATLPPLIISGKKPEPAVAPQPAPVPLAPVASAPVPAPVVTTQAIPPASPQIQAPPPQPVAAIPVEPKKPETSTAVPTASIPPQPAPVKTDLATPITQPQTAPAAANQNSANQQAAAPVQSAPKTTAANTEQVKSASKPPAPETAVAVPPRDFVLQRGILIALIAVGVIGLAVVFLLMRRPRASHTSLITSSLDREKK